MGLCTLLSVAGIVPAVGDAAKVAGTLGEFIAKNIDDTPMIIKAITEVSSQFPDIAKYLPASTFDNIATSLKNGQALTKSEYLKLKEVFEAGGKNLDEYLGVTFKYADDINFKPQSLIDELVSSGEKCTLEDIELLVKTPDGKLMWLEKGTERAGFTHIMLRHEAHFASRGVTDIKTFLYNVLEQTPVLKDVNEAGPYAEYIINGERYRVAYGTNGFIVSFFPI